jgi:hypothetical protein
MNSKEAAVSQLPVQDLDQLFKQLMQTADSELLALAEVCSAQRIDLIPAHWDDPQFRDSFQLTLNESAQRGYQLAAQLRGFARKKWSPEIPGAPSDATRAVRTNQLQECALIIVFQMHNHLVALKAWGELLPTHFSNPEYPRFPHRMLTAWRTKVERLRGYIAFVLSRLDSPGALLSEADCAEAVRRSEA